MAFYNQISGNPMCERSYMWLALLSISLLPTLAFSFILEGSVSSFAQYPRWIPSSNGSLDFLFSTTEADGLLLYTDNEGSYQFFQLTLVEGTARLRYNLGSGARLVSTGRNLNDGFWHQVRIQRRGDSTDLIVDNRVETHESREYEQTFGTPQSKGSVFFGGIASDVSRLTMAVVTLQPRFVGKIKDVTYRGADGIPKRPEMSASQGVRSENDPGPCGKGNPPCQHGGRCVTDTTMQGGRGCECAYTDYAGDYCERDRSDTEVTLRGREYIGWELRRSGGEPLTAHTDRLTLSFKTRHPAGLLFFTGDGKDYVNVALKEGGLTVTLDMGGDPLEVTVKPEKVRFDDNRWHVIRLDRRVKEINGHTSFCSLSVSVDGLYDQRRTTAGPFNQLASSRLYLGGSDQPALLPGAKTKANFVGCLRNVMYQCDGVVLRLLDMARSEHNLLQVSGVLQYLCQEVTAAEPLSFTTKESVLDGPGDGVVNFKHPDAALVMF